MSSKMQLQALITRSGETLVALRRVRADPNTTAPVWQMVRRQVIALLEVAQRLFPEFGVQYRPGKPFDQFGPEELENDLAAVEQNARELHGRATAPRPGAIALTVVGIATGVWLGLRAFRGR